jgi:Carboxypeptidase regulatory-like domain/TonB-dependent Receptor Plug Domain
VHVRLSLAVFLLFSAVVEASEVRGRVVNVVGGEPLGRVQVEILETATQAITSNDGVFSIPYVAPGGYTLRLNAVGFRLNTIAFTLAADEIKEFDITLVPDNFRRTEKVEVKGDIFQGPDSPAVIETNLTSLEIRETSTVLADDPFRAVQALPGVSAAGNNDFFAQLSVMGTPYSDVSTYIDGILVTQPFHGISNLAQGATLSLLTSETIEDVKLLPVAYPEQYGDAVGAALDIRTRDGSRTPPIFRVSLGLADSELLGEGQLGHNRRGSWLVSARKSYLGYLLRNRLDKTFTDVSFYDADLKLNYDLTPSQKVTFYGMGGHTLADLVNPPAQLQPGDFKRGTNDLMLGRIGWHWAANPHLAVEARVAYLSAPLKEWDVDNNVLDDYRDREWVEGGRVVWAWGADHVFEGGWTARRVNGGFEEPLFGKTFSTINTGWRNDGYAQQSSSFFGNRLHVVGSLRVDTASEFDIHPVSPQLSASLQVSHSTAMQFGVGRYNQFQFPAAPVFFGGTGCAPDGDYLQTANHFSAGVEHRVSEHTRIKAMFFDRQNERQLAYSGCPQILPTGFASRGTNYSRGVQVVLQSRTANRLSGWIGYTYTHARENMFLYYQPPPGGTLVRYLSTNFPTLEDQLHTLNAFASYRISPSVRLSAKFLYGSGFPIPSGTIVTIEGRPQLVGWNATRLSDYQRLDLRAEKDWAFRKWKLALYGEMLNLTNHYNPRYTQNGSNGGSKNVITEQGLPITPTAGVAFEF